MKINTQIPTFKILFLLTILLSNLLLSAKEDKPNFLWLVSEDNSAEWIGCYGNKNAKTPHIDNLAKEGFLYTQAYANAPVCGAQRSTWITGIHSLSMGTHNMRSHNRVPSSVRYYPQDLQDANYYTVNFSKTDYNIGQRNETRWNKQGELSWEQLKNNQPFFQVINMGKTHESQAKIKFDQVQHSTEEVRIAKYHPDTPEVRAGYARYHDCINSMDSELGSHLANLEKYGLNENTIVIYNSDHGGVLPRSKRFLFQSGLHCPLVIRIPEKFKNLWPAKEVGTKIDRLVSFIDMPKTWLSLAQATIPNYMQGQIFLGPQMSAEPRLHYAYRGRMDERYDNQRAVHDKQFLYVRNYMPYVAWGQKLAYLWESPISKTWEQSSLRSNNKLIKRFFTKKNDDELYDTVNDPDCTNNLISSPEHAKIITRMKKSLHQWQLDHYDSGLLHETEISKRAQENGLTIHELVRDPNLYPLKQYLKVADLALDKNSFDLEYFQQLLNDNDSGMRYWALVGFLVHLYQSMKYKDEIKILLNDDSDVVRVMAAWISFKTGQTNSALTCTKDLINSSSPALLHALNMLDNIGDEAKLLTVNLSTKISGQNNNVRKMQVHLLQKWGLEIPEHLNKKRK